MADASGVSMWTGVGGATLRVVISDPVAALMCSIPTQIRVVIGANEAPVWLVQFSSSVPYSTHLE